MKGILKDTLVRVNKREIFFDHRLFDAFFSLYHMALPLAFISEMTSNASISLYDFELMLLSIRCTVLGHV